jgi:cysteine-rich repeat protein
MLMGLALTIILAMVGCGEGDDGDGNTPTKQQLLDGQNELDWCTQFGLEPGCDICAEFGFYGDGVCDLNMINIGLCAGPDPDCSPAVCGNGIVDDAEECDDGNAVDGDGCSTLCLFETGAEVCDNGIDDDLDGLIDCDDPDCVQACTEPVCGNGIVEPGEMCDDGNAADGDGCSALCMQEAGMEICSNGMDDDLDGLVDCADSDCSDHTWCNGSCGNGIVESGEQCDDGNANAGDGCAPDCTLEPSAEICDDRADNDSDGLTDCADPDCADDAFCLCGNGVVEGNEECDDGNNTDGDGCASDCTVESVGPEICDNNIDDDMDGVIDCLDPDCSNDPACSSQCGDGVVDAGEACDDGNRDNTDGCPDDPAAGGTCQPAACGDGHIYDGIEECDTANLGGVTCQDLGYNGGTLTCLSTCLYDTSDCN